MKRGVLITFGGFFSDGTTVGVALCVFLSLEAYVFRFLLLVWWIITIMPSFFLFFNSLCFYFEFWKLCFFFFLGSFFVPIDAVKALKHFVLFMYKYSYPNVTPLERNNAWHNINFINYKMSNTYCYN